MTADRVTADRVTADRVTAVCFVCLGNICRSPIAAAVLRSMVDEAGLADRVRVESAGTAGYHEGEEADPRTQAALARHGYPTEHTARRFRAEDFGRFDLVVALDRANRRDLRRLAPDDDAASKVVLLREDDPEAPEGAEVPDPWYGGDDDFDEVVELVTAACRRLVDRLATGDAAGNTSGDAVGDGRRADRDEPVVRDP